MTVRKPLQAVVHYLAGRILPGTPVHPHVCRSCHRVVRRFTAAQRAQVERVRVASCRHCGGDLASPTARYWDAHAWARQVAAEYDAPVELPWDRWP